MPNINIVLLQHIAKHSPVVFVQVFGGWSINPPIKEALDERFIEEDLNLLAARGFITKRGNCYTIKSKGLELINPSPLPHYDLD